MTKHDYVVIGADPGRMGALACVAPDLGIVGHSRFYPSSQFGYVSGRRIHSFVREMRELADKVFLTYELVGSRPTDIHRKAFAFGGAYGGLLTMLGFLQSQDPQIFIVGGVTPQTWKAHFNLRGKGKEASIAKAKQITGLETDDHNTADAALVAVYGATHLTKIDGIRY